MSKIDIYYENIQKKLNSILFENQEHASNHNPYDQEIREFASIRNGDLEQLNKSWDEHYSGKIGTLAKTPLRHSKNHAIVLVTLACRAAIEGGVLSEIAFSLSDAYIQQIEETDTPADAFALGRHAEYQYTTLVRDLGGQSSVDSEPDSKISKCKDYIQTHLHEKIIIDDIAKELYLNKNYLCDLFKKKEGVTIGTYILSEKIRLIRNMLTYSQYSYSEIATYFGFSSQSHLGKQFKKLTGMTLHQYREKFGVKDFQDFKSAQ